MQQRGGAAAGRRRLPGTGGERRAPGEQDQAGAAQHVDEAGPHPMRIGTPDADKGKHDHQHQQGGGIARRRLDRLRTLA